jgi:tryptophan-rich sensory protein
MTLLAAATALFFYRIRRAAGLLMLPYLAWLLFAGALNHAICTLNPDAELAAPASTTDIPL